MTELVIINLSVGVCDGSRGTQVGRKSFQYVEITHELDEENSAVQPDPIAHQHHGMPK